MPLAFYVIVPFGRWRWAATDDPWQKSLWGYTCSRKSKKTRRARVTGAFTIAI